MKDGNKTVLKQVFSQKHEVFYGRAKGRPLRQSAQQALENKTLIAHDVRAIESFTILFSEIHLEIGFGAGEHLIAKASENPGIGFIGSEVFVNGVAKCARDAQDANLKNLVIWPRDARPLLDALPANSLGALYILYPDPWPKRRHWKRRIVDERNLARFARLLRPGGKLYFATDWANYAAWTLSQLLRSPDFIWEAQNARHWKEPFSLWSSTRYEKKALREKRVPSYLTFTRKA